MEYPYHSITDNVKNFMKENENDKTHCKAFCNAA